MDDFTDQLIHIRFKGLEDIRCYEALKSVSGYKDIKYKYIFKNIIKYTIKKINSVIINGNPEYIFIFSNSYSTRYAYEILFQKVIDLVPNRMQINGHIRYSLNLKKLKNLGLLFIWMRQLQHTKLSYKIKLYVASELLLGLNDSQEIIKLILDNKKDVRLVTTFCDIHCIDYIVTSRLKLLNIPTATVQHGMFEAGWKFGYSHSDYFLAHGQYAKSLAIQSGLKEDRVIPVGMMQYINVSKKTIKKAKQFNELGIILSSPENEQENNDLIKFAHHLKKKYGMKCLIRCHPALNMEKYKRNISDINIDNSRLIEEFAEKVDIVLLGNTTVFSELIFLKKICLRFIGFKDSYIGIDIGSFKDVSELDNFFKEVQNNEQEIYNQVDKLGGLLMPEGDIKIYYKKFFDKFCV